MSGIFDQVINYTPTILASQISGSVVYKGTWDAATNSPTLTSPPAATTKGWYYVVSVAGTQFSIDFAVGDWIISNGTVWQKVDLTDSVSSVFGRTGAVAAQTGDYSASQISGLGSLATQNGTFSGTSSGTNTGDQTISISGDVTAASSSGALSATVTKINGTSLAALATGILKNTTTTGVPSIAVAADFPTLNQNTTGTASNVTGTVAVANGGTGATTASGARTNLGLGSLATQSGTFSGTSSGTNTGDQTISITGDVTAAGSTGALSATVGKINGVALIGLGTGILKNSTVTGQPSIAIASDFPTLNQNTTGTAANVTGTVAVGNGGTGATTLTGYVKGSGTTALTASSTIPNTDITGLGTMSTQAASSVTITGGSINGTAIGASVPSTGAFSSATISSPLGTASGGTGVNTTPANGQVLIGNGTGYTANTLTAGSGITVTNASGSITIAATGSTSAGIITATVINAESSAITKGQVVYAFGATGNTMSVKLASNSAESTSSKTLGIVSDTSIAANSSGTITLIGEVSGLVLGSYTDGDTLYLGSTAGSLTNTKPSAPNHLVYVGVVERANNGNGILYVKVQNGYELDEIHDVQITGTPTSGSLIIRDATNSLWKNARLTAGTNIAVTNADASVTLGVTGIIGSTNGGTGNGFTKFSGPATSEKTFTLPNSSATLLYEGGAIGATTPSTGAFTTLSATGDVTASGGNILSTSGGAIPIRVSGATTGYSVMRIQNTGGDTFFGTENSAGNNLIIGCSAYDTIIRGPSGIAFSANAGAGMQMRISSTGAAITGTLSATGDFSINNASASATALINNNTGSTTLYNSLLAMQRASTTKALIGIAGGAGNVITGSALDDGVWRQVGGSLLFSFDNGSTAHAKFSSTGLTLVGCQFLSDGYYIQWGSGTNTYIKGHQANQYIQTFVNGSQRGEFNSSGLVVSGTGNGAVTATGGLTLKRTANTSRILDITMENGYAQYAITSAGSGYYHRFEIDGTAYATISSTGLAVTGNLSCTGSLSKGSGSFRIEHPLPAKKETHQLVHSFIEGPKADLIYRGKIDLVDGKAAVNIDTAATMTEGTFEVLCREVQCFTTNETGWTPVRGKVTGNILTIEAQDASCTDSISWMVVGERCDPHMMETEWTDANGRVIVEPLKPVEPEIAPKE